MQDKKSEDKIMIQLEKEEAKQFPYRDIIRMDRPISKKYKKMTLQERAIQFAPFSALSGYEKYIEETNERIDFEREILLEAKKKE